LSDIRQEIPSTDPAIQKITLFRKMISSANLAMVFEQDPLAALQKSSAAPILLRGFLAVMIIAHHQLYRVIKAAFIPGIRL
jgi:hypothetical protein